MRHLHCVVKYRRLFDITRDYTILKLNINRYCGSRRVTGVMNVRGNYQEFPCKKIKHG